MSLLAAARDDLERWARFVSDHDSDLQQVRSEAGYDKDPWLYVVFDRWRPNRPATIVAETVHFAIQAGKLKHRSISTRHKSGQTKWDKKDFK